MSILGSFNKPILDYEVGFEYRFAVRDEKKPRAFRCEPTADEGWYVMQEIKEREDAMQEYNQFGRWPRNNHSCYDYNQTCEYFKQCWVDPQHNIKLKRTITTQSLITLFDQCPRKYAELLAEAEALGIDFHNVGQPNKYAIWGIMFHIAIAMLYEQLLAQRI